MATILCEYEVYQDYSSRDIHSKAFQHHGEVLYLFFNVRENGRNERQQSRARNSQLSYPLYRFYQ